MMDLSKISTADLQALQAGDLSKVSTAGLQAYHDQMHADRVETDRAQMAKDYAPTVGMGPLERAAAGAGSAVQGAWNGIKDIVGGVSQSDLDEKARLDAPLMDTTAGKIGGALGMAGLAAPAIIAAPVLGSTYAGAAGLGAVMGAVTTPGSLEERAKAAGVGAAGGVVGKGAGDLIGAGVSSMGRAASTRLAAQQAANAGRDAAVSAGQDAGYVVTPAMTSQPNMLAKVAEAVGGKIKTQQAASVKNQAVTNQLARAALGLPEDAPLTAATLDAVRQQAGQAYDAVASSGVVKPTAAYENALDAIAKPYASAAKGFPNAKPSPVLAEIESLRSPQFDAGDAIAMIRKVRGDADAAFAGGDKQTGKALKAASNAIEDAVEEHLKAAGSPNMLQDFLDARKLIAKTYSVQGALNESTGDVVGSKLASQLTRGKPLSGELRSAAEFAQAFPRATQAGQSVPAFSVLDAGTAAGGLGSGNIPLAMLPLMRPGARSLTLSGPMQRSIGAPSYELNALERYAPALLDNKGVRTFAPAIGIGAARNTR
jgi:hypothetical protein